MSAAASARRLLTPQLLPRPALLGPARSYPRIITTRRSVNHRALHAPLRSFSSTNSCFKGVIHEGTPTGKLETLGGVETYVALPSGEYDQSTAVLFIPDIFGHPLVNNKLLVDSFAQAGFATYFPDIFSGDAIPVDAMNNPNSTFDKAAWFAKHGVDATRPILDKTIAYLKEQGVTKIAATGYCFGGQYSFLLAFDNVIQVAAGSHPSRCEVPGYLDRLLAESQVPMLVNACETDAAWPAEAQAKANEILGGGKYAPGWRQTYYEKAKHGFAVRGDLSDPNFKFAKEDSFRETVEWFKKYTA